MPIARFEMPDGRVARFEVPEGTTPEQAQAMIAQMAPSIQPKGVTTGEAITKGMRDPIDGGAQLLTNILPEGLVKAGNTVNNWLADKTGMVGRLPEGGVDQQVREQEAQYQAARGPNAGFDWGRTAGNILSPANIAIASGVPAAATLTGRVGFGAAAGAVGGAMTPTAGAGDFATEKAKQIGMGTVVGGAVPMVMGGVSRVVSPRASLDPNVKLLQAEGVTPTMGQALGGRANVVEEKLTSIPILGDAISSARGRALDQFNNAAINRATAPIGQKVQGTGQTAIRQAGDSLSQAYDDALAQIKVVKFDQQFGQDLTQLKSMAQSLTPPMRSKFNTKLQEVVGGRTSMTGHMLGDTFKKVDSEIGNLAAKYRASSVASEAELGDALTQLQSLLKQQAARSNPKAAEALAKADEGWANLVRIEQAGKIGKNAEGMFTPGQLNTAIQTADKSVRKRAVARGDALMQDLGSAGQAVLGNKTPNSFTTDRALLAAGSLGSYMVNPAIPAGLLLGAGMYSRPMQGLLTNAITSRPQSAQAIADAIRQASPGFGLLGGQVGTQLLNN